MKISAELTDDAILAEVGARLARQRLDIGLTQAELAEQAGVSKRTVERLEAGASTQLTSFLRILRTLELLQGLDALLPTHGPGPMLLLRGKGKVPKRASRNRVAEQPGDWSWEDEA